MTASFTSTSYQPDNLVADASTLLAQPITLAAGQNLKRGSVLGKITVGSKHTLSLAASNDGSQVPDVILAEDTDASAGDVGTIAYVRGDFLRDCVTLGAGHTAVGVSEALRDKGIFLI